MPMPRCTQPSSSSNAALCNCPSRHAGDSHRLVVHPRGRCHCVFCCAGCCSSVDHSTAVVSKNACRDSFRYGRRHTWTTSTSSARSWAARRRRSWAICCPSRCPLVCSPALAREHSQLSRREHQRYTVHRASAYDFGQMECDLTQPSWPRGVCSSRKPTILCDL